MIAVTQKIIGACPRDKLQRVCFKRVFDVHLDQYAVVVGQQVVLAKGDGILIRSPQKAAFHILVFHKEFNPKQAA